MWPDGEFLSALLEETKDGEWGSDAPGPGRAEAYVIRGTDFPAVRNGDFSSVPRRFIEERLLERKRLRAGDVLIETAGGSKGRPTGRTLLITEDLVRHFNGAVVCASFARFLRADPTKVVPEYLFWCLQEMYQCGEMEQHQVQHTGIARFQYTRFAERTRIALPSKSEQQRIAGVLCPLDERVVVLHRMNQTLEAMAQALFRSWFVDFDPVRAKAEGRRPDGMDAETAALFPASFTEGIPAGWAVRPLAEVCLRIAIGPFGSSIKTDNFVQDGVPVIRGQNLSDGFRDDSFVFLTEAKADELSSAIAVPGDIVLTHRGTLGQVGLIPARARYRRYVISQSQMLARPDDRAISRNLVYRYFRSSGGKAELLANTSTTGVPAIGQPTTTLKKIPIIVPSVEVSRRFDGLVEPLSARMVANDEETRTLCRLRDLLLPKLLSGEIRVRDAEAQLTASA